MKPPSKYQFQEFENSFCWRPINNVHIFDPLIFSFALQLFTLLGEAASSWVGGICQETEGGVSGDAQVRYPSEQLSSLDIVL